MGKIKLHWINKEHTTDIKVLVDEFFSEKVEILSDKYGRFLDL